MIHLTNTKFFYLCLLIWIGMLLLCLPAKAQKTAPVTTHPPLYMTPEEPVILDFEKDIGMIVIPHTSNVNILQDSARRIVIVPHEPGSIHFSIMDTTGKPLMKRYAIVGARGEPQKQYVRIRRSCNASVVACEEMSFYFCDQTCHRMLISKAGAIPMGTGMGTPPGAPQSAGGLSPEMQEAFKRKIQEQAEEQNYRKVELNMP